MNRSDWTVITIVMALMLGLMTLAAMAFPEHSTCLAYNEPYRSACINMDDSNKDQVKELFYDSRGYTP